MISDRSVAHYQLLQPLGTGGMGEVHLALDLRLGRQVALKFLKPEYLDDREARRRFEFEARAAAILNHPNITTLYDFDADQGYMSLEYVAGITLEERLAEGTLPVPAAARIVGQVCRALAHAHGRNVVHRDLKPSNVLLGTDGSVKLTDFGLAKIRDASPRTSTGTVLGTAAYMCPEQIRAQGMDRRGDLFAAGVLLYRAVSGRSPWSGDGVAILYSILHDTPPPLRSIDPALPPALDALVARLLEKEPENRFTSAEEVEGYLAEIEAAAGPPAPPPRADMTGVVPGVPSIAAGAATESPPATPAAGAARPAAPLPPRHGEPAPAPRRNPLVGRGDELARLEEALAEARLGRGRTLLFAGEAGAGKSRLMEEFRSRAEAAGILGLMGRCTLQAARNFQPFVEALEEFARRAAGNSPRAEELSAAHPSIAAILPTLELLLDPGDDPALEPKSREQLWHLVDTLLKRIARREPLVLFLDDLHWADEGTLSLLHHVTRNLGRSHLLIVGSYRPEELVRGGDQDPPLLNLVQILSSVDSFARIDLDPLDEAATGALLAAASPGAPPDAARLAAIHRRAMGNPFFALELARLMDDSGAVASAAAPPGTGASARGPADGLPRTIADVLARRLSRLAPEERDILEMAAIEGDVFHTDVLEEGTGLPRLTLLKRLRTLHQAHHLIRPAEEGHRFSHGLIREVLLRSIPAELRAEYHAVVAATLQRGYSDRADYAGQIGHHLLEGARHAEAVPFLTRAGHEARRLFLADRALGFYDQALLALDRSGADAEVRGTDGEKRGPDGEMRGAIERARCETLLVSGRPEAARGAAEAARIRARAASDRDGEAAATAWIGEAALAQGDHAAAESWLGEAFRLAEERSDWGARARAEQRLGELAARRGEYETAIERLESARRSFQELGDDSGMARVRLDAGEILVRQGKYGRAREFFEAAFTQLVAAGDRPGQVKALNWLGSVAFQEGTAESSLELFQQALALAREIGQLQESARLQANIGNIHLVRGELDRALQAYRDALARFEEIGDQRGAAQSFLALGNVACTRGEFAAAAGDYERALRAREAIGDRWGAANALDNLGVVEYFLGRWAEALGHFEAALLERTDLGDRPGQAESLLNLAALCALVGRAEDAARRQDEAMVIARKMDDRRRQARVLLSRACLALWGNDHAGAGILVAEARALEPDEPGLRARLLLYEGLALGPVGGEAAMDCFTAAAAEARRAGSVPDLAAAEIGHAQACLLAGRRDEARALSAGARRLVDDGRVPLLELRALSLERLLLDAGQPEEAALLGEIEARRAELLARLEAALPAGDANARFARAPFPIP